MRTFSNFATNRFCSTRSIERLERVSSFAINDLQRHDRNGDQSFFALLPFLALRNTSPIVMPRMTIPRCCHRDMSGPALKEMRSAPTASPQCGCGTWRIAFTNRADQWAHAHYLMIGSNSVQNVHHSGTAYSRCGRSALEMLGWNRGNCEGRHPPGWLATGRRDRARSRDARPTPCDRPGEDFADRAGRGAGGSTRSRRFFSERQRVAPASYLQICGWTASTKGRKYAKHCMV